jgi:hypothetical protein
MKIEVRKYQLIEQVMNLNENQLEKLESFLAEESANALSKSLDRALKQVKEGKVSPHAQVRKKYEKWL